MGWDDGNRLDLHQQVFAAKRCLDTGTGGEEIEPLLLVEGHANLVERLIVTGHVAQVTSGADHVVPVGPFSGQQALDVLEGAPGLCLDVAPRGSIRRLRRRLPYR